MNESKPIEEKPGPMKFEAELSQMKPLFSNFTQSFYTYENWLLDFVHNFNDQTILISRITITPSHMKNIALLFNQQVKEYEEKFGEIRTEIN